VWFGTYGGGVSKYNGAQWTTYNTTNGLADNNVTSIAFDILGNKWFGTYKGVSKFDAHIGLPIQPKMAWQIIL